MGKMVHSAKGWAGRPPARSSSRLLGQGDSGERRGLPVPPGKLRFAVLGCGCAGSQRTPSAAGAGHSQAVREGAGTLCWQPGAVTVPAGDRAAGLLVAAVASDLLTSQPWQWGLCQPTQDHLNPQPVLESPQPAAAAGGSRRGQSSSHGAGRSQVLDPRALRVPPEAGPGVGM